MGAAGRLFEAVREVRRTIGVRPLDCTVEPGSECLAPLFLRRGVLGAVDGARRSSDPTFKLVLHRRPRRGAIERFKSSILMDSAVILAYFFISLAISLLKA